ncbi:Flagellar hook protein FlgE [compost metagenome]
MTANANPDGALEPLTANSAEDGTGAIIAGQLEMSNVDLTGEFTEMIVAQRGFQANSRIITTSDEILQEVVNLKR